MRATTVVSLAALLLPSLAGAVSFSPTIISAESRSYQRTWDYWVQLPEPPGWSHGDDFGEVRSITYDIKEYTFLAHWNPENHRHFVFQDGIYSASWTIGVRRQYLGVPPHWRDVSYDTEFSWRIGDTTIVAPDQANHGSLGYAFNNNIYTQRHVPDDPYDLSTSGIFYVNNLKPEINEGHWLALINSLLVGSIEAGDDLGYIGVKWPSLVQDTTPDTWSIRVAFGHAPSVGEPSELAGSILAIGIAVLLRRHRKRS